MQGSGFYTGCDLAVRDVCSLSSTKGSSPDALFSFERDILAQTAIVLTHGWVLSG